MFRAVLSALAVAATLAIVPVDVSAAQPAAEPQMPPVPAEFNQTLIDRWLAAFPAITTLGQSPGAPLNESDGMSRMLHICTNAGFDSFDQCASTIGYAGMLMSGFDPRSGTFRDPIGQARDNIAIVEADGKLSPEAKAKATALMRQIIAKFPKDIPADHLHLMTANRDRIFKVLKSAAKK